MLNILFMIQNLLCAVVFNEYYFPHLFKELQKIDNNNKQVEILQTYILLIYTGIYITILVFISLEFIQVHYYKSLSLLAFFGYTFSRMGVHMDLNLLIYSLCILSTLGIFFIIYFKED